MRFPAVASPGLGGEYAGGPRLPTVEDRMRLAVELSRLNARHGTGGSFGGFDLGGEDLPPYELVASTEPCARCLGATPLVRRQAPRMRRLG